MFNEDLEEIFEQSEQEKYLKELDRFRYEYIPKRYNQVKLLNELMNPEIDHFISISNRTDGKSFNYIHALLNIVIHYEGLGLSFFSRNVMLRDSYKTLIEEIIDFSPLLDRKDFNFIRTQYYVSLNYKDRTIGLISALNDATELKYFSNFIKKFPILIYDEFLALETDYLTDEWERLKTIYESIDRIEDYPLIGKPKIFYFGNAVNFESPILHGLKIFNILENHPINTARIYKYGFNVMLEIHRNDNANEQRNTRAFGSGDDSMSTAQFETNSHNIATEGDKNHVMMNPRKFYVKLKDSYLKVWFNRESLLIILSVESKITGDYLFNTQLKDNKAHSVYLNERYYDERHIRKIDRGAYRFENNYSKNFITGDYNHLDTLNILKMVRYYLKQETPETERESKEDQYHDNYMEQTKRGLMRKMWG